jgi:triacylglycerol lipase
MGLGRASMQYHLPFLALLGMLAPMEASLQNVSGRKVFLIHGIDDNGAIFSRMERELRAKGYEVILIEYYPNNGRMGMEGLADQVGGKIEAQTLPEEGFAVVAFSMGGLVTRAYLQSPRAVRKPRILFTLATPHHGTWMAWVRWNAGGREMRRGSRFLRRLAEGKERLSGIRHVAIRTPLDLIILPSTSSRIDGAENISIPVLLHPLMVRDRRVIAKIIEGLDEVFSEH